MNALPRILWRPDICGQLAPNGSEQRACQLQFGRVLLADDAYTMELLRAEREELLLALQRTGAEASEEEELTFIEMALVAVDIRMRDFDERRRLRNAVADTLAPRSSECSFAPTPSYSQLYFYQAADGQQLFLSPLDIRVLKGLFHEYKQFPDRIEVPLADVEELAMSEVSGVGGDVL